MLDLFGQIERKTNEAVYEVGNKIITATRTDPYGLWHLTIDRGKLPEWMADGCYTTLGYAEEAIERYKREAVTKNAANG